MPAAPRIQIGNASPAPLPGDTGRDPARDPALDGLRGLAMLLVYLYHYGGGLQSSHALVRLFGAFVQCGWTGVDLFFALSGFLITGLLWSSREQPHALRNFYARRALRILPLYYAALAAAAITATVVGATPTQLRPVLLYVGFLQNIPPLVPTALHYPTPLLLNHLWSLAVEEQFYLLWPFLLLAASTRRRAFHLCLWIFALSFAFRCVVFAPGLLATKKALDWSPFLLTRAGGLALGGAVALAPAAGLRPRTRAVALPVTLGALLLFFAVGLANHSFLLVSRASFMLGLPAVQVAAAALLVVVRGPGLIRRLISFAPLRLLGRISYGFYVLHILIEPLFDAIGRWTVHASSGSAYQLVRLLVAFPITGALAWLSFRYFERPFLRLKRFFPRQPAPSV